jgi:putative transposase
MGISILASPPRAPRATVGALRRAVLDRLLIAGEHHLRLVLPEYPRHRGAARPHRAHGQLTPAQAHTWPSQISLAEHRIRRNKSSADSRECHVAA